MQNPANLIPVEALARADDIVALALDMLAQGGVVSVAPALHMLVDAGLPADDPRLQPAIIEAVFLLLEALEDAPGSPEMLDLIASIDPGIAEAAKMLLFMANFPDGTGTVADLGDATVICLAALAIAAGKTEEALAFLRKAETNRVVPRFMEVSHALRCRLFGVPADIAALWLEPLEGHSTVEAARAAIDAQPLDIAAHRALVRGLAQAGEPGQALDALLTALALPIGDMAKAGLGTDLAALAAWLQARGHSALMLSPRAGFAFAACPGAMREAQGALAGASVEGAWAAIDREHVEALAGHFGGFAEQQRPAYPLVKGKPHVDIVWLEITNFCNQKCSFCPDMHREDKRQWLPVADIKRIIDQLADEVSVGSMQLNAYGEPLLHPNIDEILAYIREKKLRFPTYFTTHGMTLVDKKLAQLSNNYPRGIAVSLHNDSQDSYERSRSAKIGNYETLVTRISALLDQMVQEGAPSHVRLYQMVCNGRENPRVPPEVRAAFPHDAERMMRHVRKWEAIAARIAERAPVERHARAITNSWEHIQACFRNAGHGDNSHMRVLSWVDGSGNEQHAFMSPRPVDTYANLLLEYHPTWQVERKLLTPNRCGFVAKPSLAIFATGKLGICCLDLNSSATFGDLADYGSIREALESVEARRMFAQLANGVAVSRGCQICLAGDKQLCGPAKR